MAAEFYVSLFAFLSGRTGCRTSLYFTSYQQCIFNLNDEVIIVYPFRYLNIVWPILALSFHLSLNFLVRRDLTGFSELLSNTCFTLQLNA